MKPQIQKLYFKPVENHSLKGEYKQINIERRGSIEIESEVLQIQKLYLKPRKVKIISNCTMFWV